MITYLLVGLIVFSLAVIGLLVAARSAAVGERADGGGSLLARLFALWVISTVFFRNFFGEVHIPGLIGLSLERLCFLGLLVAMAGAVFRGRVSFAGKKSLDVLVLAFIVLCLVSMTVHGFSSTHPSLEKPWFTFLSGYLFPFIGFFVAKYFLVGDKDDRCLVRGLYWMGLAIAVIALMEGLGWRDYVWPRYIADKTVTLHLDRARGPFLNAAFTGLALCVGLVAGLMLLLRRRFPGLLFHALLLALFLPAIYYTRTRSVFLQFVCIGLGVATVLRTSFPKWKVYAVPAFLVCLVLLANLHRFASAERAEGGLAQMQEVAIRFELVHKSLALMAEHPFLGVGLGQFRNTGLALPEENDLQHNHLIGIAAEFGLVGIGVYLGILTLICRRLFKLFAVIPEEGFYNANFVFLVGLILVCNLASNTFVEPTPHEFANLNFFLFAGMVDRLTARYAASRRG
jgi:hypothetical protein